MVIAYHVIGNALLGRCESKQDRGGAAGTPKNNYYRPVMGRLIFLIGLYENDFPRRETRYL